MPQQTSQAMPATNASLFLMTLGNFMAKMIPSGFMANAQEDETKKGSDEDEDKDVLSSSSELLDLFNNVLADVVNGQKYLKETGTTKPRPMKRRSLVVCLAMGAIQPYLTEVKDRVRSLQQTATSSFAKTLCLASQLSVGAFRAIESIAVEYRREVEQQTAAAAAEVETTMGNLRQTTSSSLARAKSLVSQLSMGASRAFNYITEEFRKSKAEQFMPAAA